MNTEKIKKSINIIIKSGINYEFRTTIYPKYIDIPNVEKIAKYLSQVGSKEYVLQNYYDYDHKIKPYSIKKLEKMKEICEHYLPTKLKGLL